MRKFLLGLIALTLVISSIVWATSPTGIKTFYPAGSLPTPLSSSSTSAESQQQSYAREVLRLDFGQKIQKPLNEFKSLSVKQVGWIPDWDFYNGYSSLVQAGNKFRSISPVWYYLKPGGGVTVSRSGLNELRALRSSRGIKIIPSIASFNSDHFHQVLKTERAVQKHVDFLISEVETYELDGLDLDYESIYFHDQENYLLLAKKLYQYLDTRGKKLTIAVMPNWGYQNMHRGSPQTKQAQDWQVLGQYSHELRLMTYNLTHVRGKFPGPIAPLDWMEANLRYASLRVDPEKIYLGVHLYAYAGWSERPDELRQYLGVFANPSQSQINASALVYDDIVARRSSSSMDVYRKDIGESVLAYSQTGSKRIAYYIDARGMQARRDLAKRYGIGGLAYWRLGGEDVSGY